MKELTLVELVYICSGCFLALALAHRIAFSRFYSKNEQVNKEEDGVKLELEIKQTSNPSIILSSNPPGKLLGNDSFDLSILSLFVPWKDRPAIDPLFSKLLEQVMVTQKDVEQYSVVQPSDPQSLFRGFQKDNTDVAMTAKEILIHFSKYRNQYSEKNWFVLTTQPQKNASEITAEDLRLVNIMETSKGKYLLYCLSFRRWSALSASWIDNESSIYIPKYVPN